MKTARIAKLCAKMKEAGVDQYVVTAKTNIYYFTGKFLDPMRRLLALIIDADGTCTYYVNRLFVVDEEPGCEIIRWDDLENPVEMMAKKIKDNAVVAIDQDWQARFLLGLIDAKSNARYISNPKLIDDLRTIKDAEEIEIMKKSSQINDLVMEEIWANISPAVTEAQLARMRYELYAKHGANAYGSNCIFSYGPQCAEAHHVSDDTVLKPGDSVMIDMGAPYLHYCSDQTRTVFYQTVSPEMEKVYNIVLQAHLQAMAMVKPGVLCCDIDKKARDIITDAGYGEYFTHRTGHGIGLDTHEFPDISGNCKAPVQTGMIFSIEPGIYLPGKGGVRVEDLIIVTETGFESINHLPKELKIIK